MPFFNLILAHVSPPLSTVVSFLHYDDNFLFIVVICQFKVISYIMTLKNNKILTFIYSNIRIWFWGEHQISSDFSPFPPTDSLK